MGAEKSVCPSKPRENQLWPGYPGSARKFEKNECSSFGPDFPDLSAPIQGHIEISFCNEPLQIPCFLMQTFTRPSVQSERPRTGPENDIYPKVVGKRCKSLDGRNRAIVIAESLARVIAAIRITSVRWRSYLPLKTQKLVLVDPAFVALRFESRDWCSLV